MKPFAGVVILIALAACTAPPDTPATVTGRLVSGPICPVETDPPDPSCLPQPVQDVEVVAMDDSGNEYRAVAGADGRFSLSVPLGDLTITFPELEGLVGTPEAITITVVGQGVIDLGEIGYDTGIR